MRKLLILCGIFLFFILGSVWVQNALGRTSESLLATLDRAIDLVIQKDWNQATTAFSDFEKQWAHVEKWWALTTDHEEIDEISQSLEKARAHLIIQNDSGALSELMALTYLINHIPEKERLTLTTLF